MADVSALFDDSVPPITAFVGPYRFLSNFFWTNVRYRGLVYPTAEHAYQAAKSTDPEVKQEIKLLASPGLAKRCTRSAEFAIRADWDLVKVGVMTEIVRAKFRDAVLREKLLATWPAKLVEGNGWHDRFWGACGCNRCGGTGENRLGEILMRERYEIRCERETRLV